MPVINREREALQGLLRGAKAYDDNLNAREQVPDGDDYNVMLGLINAAAISGGLHLRQPATIDQEGHVCPTLAQVWDAVGALRSATADLSREVARVGAVADLCHATLHPQQAAVERRDHLNGGTGRA